MLKQKGMLHSFSIRHDYHHAVRMRERGGTANLDASTSSNGAQLASISVTRQTRQCVNTEIQFHRYRYLLGQHNKRPDIDSKLVFHLLWIDECGRRQ